MPHHKTGKHNRHKDDAKHTNEPDCNGNVQVVNNPRANEPPAAMDNHHIYKCSLPSGCRSVDESIVEADPGDAIRVICNNENCTISKWMHKDCFGEFEDSVLAYLRSCGRARSWSEKQRFQNLWTKKGYDLAFKACDCKCGRGHVRKDLDYIPPPVNDNAKKHKKGKKKNDKPQAVMTNSNGKGVAIPHNNSNGHHQANSFPKGSLDNGNGNTPGTPTNMNMNGSSSSSHGVIDIRMRTDSLDSTGSSPPNSVTSSSNSSSPVSVNFHSNGVTRKPRFEYFPDPAQAIAGNIFKKRQDLSVLQLLPKFKQNAYYVKMEDDGPHGNDDTRNFVLSHLSSYKVSTLACVLCKCDLCVYDKYPLIDGSMFLSPQAYDESVVQVIWEGKLQCLNAVCINCMAGNTEVKCSSCKQSWNGGTLVMGTMYTYDIFAATPCCQKRLTCKSCRRAVVDIARGLPFFSEYSHMLICPYCKCNDYHFIRSLRDTFIVKKSIWN